MKLDSTNSAVQGRNNNSWFKYLLSLTILLAPSVMHAQVCQFTASQITGPSNACAHVGNSGQPATYSVNTTDASAFVWTLPAQATLLSGQGTNTILVRFKNDFTGGTISVQISNACGGDGASRTIQIGKVRPAAPLSVNGPPVICELGVPVNYIISAVPGATQYNWAVPSNSTLVSGQGTTSITVLFSD
ncbi:MAG TPA: hypothetical protein VK589_06820, partial [Chryseolinea sp.]|nr:hypothetical protein [Chryseolinea sp.]